MISECACCATCRISVVRYPSGIQSRGSIRWSAATVASKCACRSLSSGAAALAVGRSSGGADMELPPGDLLTKRSVIACLPVAGDTTTRADGGVMTTTGESVRRLGEAPDSQSAGPAERMGVDELRAVQL